jgi:hypothetical protein
VDGKTKYKYEVATAIGVSTRTLSRWLNEKYFSQLQGLGYEKNQKYLLPNQIEFLNKKLCIYVQP